MPSTTASSSSTASPLLRKPLRLWPGVALGILIWVLRGIVPLVAADTLLFEIPVEVIGMIGALVCSLAILVWWLVFSRAPWVERFAALALVVLFGLVTYQFLDVSVIGGHMGLTFPLYAPPIVTTALVVWALATRHLTTRARRTSLVATIAIAYVPFTMVRTAGVFGAGSEWHWRWTPTPEERLLAEAKDEPPAATTAAVASPVAPAAPENETAKAPTPNAPAPMAAPAAPQPAAPSPVASPVVADESGAEWPGFRGPERNSVIRGVRINTDWTQSPPVELWRRPIGPGWSSFAVAGDLIYTQEQRGDDEIVACYRLSTGAPVWRHRDAIRFYESNAGPGPRGTPTVHNGRVYSMGATGLLNALDAQSGARVWSRNTIADTGKTIPDWGIASSPLVLDDLVIVAVAGQLAAYDAHTGTPRWMGQSGGAGYSSPHLLMLDGVPQVLLMRGARTISVSPADGTLLWDHTGGPPATSMLQPALMADGDLLLANGDAMGGLGIRRVSVSRSEGGWKAEERWHSRGLKPYFNDFVAHNGHAYGFDGSILSAIDLADGMRKWKGGRYGNGQLLLLADQDVLLVISEEGELALVSATPDKFNEIARFPALNAKTWNHPVLVRDVLLVRNGEEMVAFRLR